MLLCFFLLCRCGGVLVSKQKAVERCVIKGVYSLSFEALGGRVSCALCGATTQLYALAFGHALAPQQVRSTKVATSDGGERAWRCNLHALL